MYIAVLAEAEKKLQALRATEAGKKAKQRKKAKDRAEEAARRQEARGQGPALQEDSCALTCRFVVSSRKSCTPFLGFPSLTSFIDCRTQKTDLGFRFPGLGFRVSGFRVQGLGFRDLKYTSFKGKPFPFGIESCLHAANHQP